MDFFTQVKMIYINNNGANPRTRRAKESTVQRASKNGLNHDIIISSYILVFAKKYE